MAICRAGGQEVDYPNDQTILEEGDRLLLVGESAELAAFNKLAKGEAAVPDENMLCHWLMVPVNSPVVSQTLLSLDIWQQYRVQLQAIRRDGKFFWFSGGSMSLKAGDQLLLCGGYPALSQIQQWILPTTYQIPVVPTVVVEAEPLL